MRRATPATLTIIVSLALVTLITTSPARAAEETEATAIEPIVPDRPDFTDGVQVVPRGTFQVEGGMTLSRTGSDDELAIGELLFRIPIASKLELRLFAPSHVRASDHDETATGFSDGAVGIKLGLTGGNPKSKAIPATAFLVTTTVPTGSDEISDNEYQPEAKLALEWTLSDNLGLGANIGYARPSDSGESFDQLFATVSAGIGISEKVGAFVEVYGFHHADASGASAAYADTGVSYLVNPDLSLDARIGFGLGNDVEGSEYYVGVGVSRRF